MATALIVYASLTGNTEEIADILAEALEKWPLDYLQEVVPQLIPGKRPCRISRLERLLL